MKKEKLNKILSGVKNISFVIMVFAVFVMMTQLVFKDLLPSQYTSLALPFWLFLSSLIFFIAAEVKINDFSINKSFNGILSSYLVSAVATIIIVISLGLFLFIADKYAIPSSSDEVSIPIVQKESTNISNKTSTESVQNITEASNRTSTESVQNSEDISSKISNGISQDSAGASNGMSDDTLLGILAILISFTGFLAAVLSYAFHRIIKKELHDEIVGKVEAASKDQHISLSAETRLSASHIFSTLHGLTESVKKGENCSRNGNCDNCRIFENNNFLEIAINFDKTATRVLESVNNIDSRKGLYLRILNNRVYNLYLKYLKWTGTGGEERGRWMLTKEEKMIILRARYELRKSIVTEEYRQYDDISSYHILAWSDTCDKIDELVASSKEWEELDKVYRETIKDC